MFTQGEAFGFLGNNSSGNTKTIRALLGIYQPSAFWSGLSLVVLRGVINLRDSQGSGLSETLDEVRSATERRGRHGRPFVQCGCFTREGFKSIR